MNKMVRSLSTRDLENKGLIKTRGSGVRPEGEDGVGSAGQTRPSLFTSFSQPSDNLNQAKLEAILDFERKQNENDEDEAPAITYVPPSDYEIQRMRGMFNFLDENGNGAISRTEFATGVRFAGLNPTKAEVDQLWKDAAMEDGSEEINFDGFVRALSNSTGKRAIIEEEKMKLTAAFNCFDEDRKGFILADDLMKVLCSMGEEPFTEDESRAFFNKLDRDKDGQVSYKEFVEEMCSNAYVV